MPHQRTPAGDARPPLRARTPRRPPPRTPVDAILDLQRAAGNGSVERKLARAARRRMLQRAITVGGQQYTDVDDAKADAPRIPGLDPRLVDQSVARAFLAGTDYASEAAWYEAIEQEHTLPANRRIGVMNNVHGAGLGHYAFAWTQARTAYLATRTDGGALSKQVWVAYDWVDDFGYASLGQVIETPAEVTFRIRVPTRYWPITNNQRTNHAFAVITPALLQAMTQANAFLQPGAAPNLPGAPAVFTPAYVPGAAPNQADRALVAKAIKALEPRYQAEQDLVNALNSGNHAAAMRAQEVIETQNHLVMRVLADLAITANHPDRPAAIKHLRGLAAEIHRALPAPERQPEGTVGYALGLLVDPLEQVEAAAAYLAHQGVVAAAGLPNVQDFNLGSVFTQELIRHAMFAAPRSDGEFIALGISGGHVEANLRDFLAAYPEYDVVPEEEGADHTVYRQFKWMSSGPATVRESRRPSGEGGMAHHQGWVEAGYKKTVANVLADFLEDAENSFRAWLAANAAQVAALAPGAAFHNAGGGAGTGPFESVGYPGIAYEAHLKRIPGGELVVTTIYPVVG
jgi:hypothetical protein